jgi:hypothetical protein
MSVSTEIVPALLMAEIRRQHEAAQDAFRSAVEHAIRCGELLAEAKAQLPHGGWGAWLAENFPASDRTARGYMRLAAHAEEVNRQGLADLGIEGALRELAAPRDDLNAAPDEEAEGKIEELRWILWREDWRRDTGEPAPPDPRGLWEWLQEGPLYADLLGCIGGWALDPSNLEDWHCRYMLESVAPEALLRTANHPPPPPSYEPQAAPAREGELGRIRVEANRILGWNRRVEANAGQLIADFDRLGWPWDGEIDAEEARRLMVERGGDRREWDDEDVRHWAVGYTHSRFQVPHWDREAA